MRRDITIVEAMEDASVAMKLSVGLGGSSDSPTVERIKRKCIARLLDELDVGTHLPASAGASAAAALLSFIAHSERMES